jgi:hypothetical protein
MLLTFNEFKSQYEPLWLLSDLKSHWKTSDNQHLKPQIEPFLGAFAKLLEATISFVMTICPSVCLYAWNNSAPTGQIFMEFDIFQKSVKKI